MLQGLVCCEGREELVIYPLVANRSSITVHSSDMLGNLQHELLHALVFDVRDADLWQLLRSEDAVLLRRHGSRSDSGS